MDLAAYSIQMGKSYRDYVDGNANLFNDQSNYLIFYEFVNKSVQFKYTSSSLFKIFLITSTTPG